MSHTATAEQTRAYAQHFSNLFFNSFGQSGWLCSQAGFGAYRIHRSVEEHRNALRKALLSGINVIDTSSNYGDGASEQLIGEVLQDIIQQGTWPRQAFVIISKAGYLQGQNYQNSQQLKGEGKPWPDLVEYSPGLEHCIHPDFIVEQIDQSLKRLQLSTIDVYLLHNPEYYLSWAQQLNIPVAEARREYYHRIETAFVHLEKEVRRGRIHFYGISSNTFPASSDDASFTCLETVWNIAASIRPGHHFRVVQMPLNLLEHQAVTAINQPSMQSVLEFAGKKKLAVLINRPLNAYTQRRLFRLSDLPAGLLVSTDETEKQLHELIRLEDHFDRELIDTFELEPAAKKTVSELFATGSYLAVNWQKLGPYQQWLESQARYMVERINQGMQILTAYPHLNEQQKRWIDDYIDTFNAALDGLTALLHRKAARQAEAFKKEIAGIDSGWDAIPKLSHKALHALRGTPGVTSVLIGMRHPDYVDDVLEELHQPLKEEYAAEFWLNLKEQLKGWKMDK